MPVLAFAGRCAVFANDGASEEVEGGGLLPIAALPF